MASDRWPYCSPNYLPYLHNGHDLQRVIKEFEKTLLSDITAVELVSQKCLSGGKICSEIGSLKAELESTPPATRTEHLHLFVNRFLVKNRNETLPSDANKLRIDKPTFHYLLNQLDLAPSFVSALAQLHLPPGRGARHETTKKGFTGLKLWYILPLRIQVACSDKEKSHVSSTAGNNQMDPFSYLHLADAEVDVRGSHIAVASEYHIATGTSKTVSFNFMDGRWSRSAEEPKRRLIETLAHLDRFGIDEDPFSIHVINLSSTARWFTNSLSSLNSQLIAFEKRLQDDVDGEVGRPSATYGVVSRALHAIAAHLHRYGSELKAIQNILEDLRGAHHHYCNARPQSGAVDTSQGEHDVEKAFQFLASQLDGLSVFRDETEVKLQNILALLFNRIQITNDRLMVANGDKQHAILLAIQEDSRISRIIADKQGQLAEEMKEDSVAMKTIAVTTMFFLPGTSFAAFLSMPFVANSDYMKDPQTLWIWVVCTVPATVMAFAFYFYWRHRSNQRRAAADKNTCNGGTTSSATQS